jgi:hypothetical protein
MGVHVHATIAVHAPTRARVIRTPIAGTVYRTSIGPQAPPISLRDRTTSRANRLDRFPARKAIRSCRPRTGPTNDRHLPRHALGRRHTLVEEHERRTLLVEDCSEWDAADIVVRGSEPVGVQHLESGGGWGG